MHWVTCSFITKITVTVVCLETTPKTKNSDHVFSLSREVPCTADATVYAQECSSVYRAVLAFFFISKVKFVLHLTFLRKLKHKVRRL